MLNQNKVNVILIANRVQLKMITRRPKRLKKAILKLKKAAAKKSYFETETLFLSNKHSFLFLELALNISFIFSKTICKKKLLFILNFLKYLYSVRSGFVLNEFKS